MKPFLSHPHIILMIGDDGIVAIPYGLKEAEPFFAPTDDRQATQEISDFIARYPQARITLCADNLAQDYRSDLLPHLNFLDRAKLIARRLKHSFPAARLTASLRFKKDRNRVLMIGLHDSNPVFAWADRLGMRLPTITLLPVEGARIVDRLMPEAAHGWAMLITRQKSGGFRQIVTHKTDLIFTRLTPLPPEGTTPDGIMATIAHDIKASLDYLTRHGLKAPRELAALLIMQGDVRNSADLENLGLHAIHSLTPAAAAQKLALPFAPAPDDDAADLLFAGHMLASLRPALPLMLPDTRQQVQTQAIRRWGLRLASASLAIVIVSSIWRAGDLAATLYQTEKEAVQLAQTKRMLATAQANAAPLTEPLGRMRIALQRRHIYEQPMAMPWQGIGELAAGLDPQAVLVKLDWKKENDAVPEIFSVSLRIAPEQPDNDRAGSVAAFTRLTQNIARAAPDYNVAIVKPPYPALPQESVTIATASDTNDPQGEITLQRKAP